MKEPVIGYTQGTFDVFHIGHLNLIRNAAKNCDKLIVGVNSDALVEAYKSKTPANSEKLRLDIIKSLKEVDEVVLCDTLDKESAWQKFHFDKIFIGSDWQGNDRWQQTEEVLEKHGAKVVYLPHTDGISSTQIRSQFSNINPNDIGLSVIIPLYNAERYILSTVVSWLGEMDERTELIIIDDCSKDKSYEICRMITDPRLIVIKNRNNHGICYTRNKGIKEARGKYIMFADDDDDILPGIISSQLPILDQHPKVDMLKFGRRLICTNSHGRITYQEDTTMQYSGLVSADEKYHHFFKIRSSKALLNVWNGIYKKSAVIKNHLFFDESMKYGSEDADFSLAMYQASSAVYLNPHVFYIHYKRKSSSTSYKFNRNKVASILKTAEREQAIWQHINLSQPENRLAQVYAVNSYINMIMIDQVFHKNSNIKYRERKAIFQTAKSTLLNDYHPNLAMRQLRHQSKKQYLIAKVLLTDNYPLIDTFYRFAALIRNRRWQ